MSASNLLAMSIPPLRSQKVIVQNVNEINFYAIFIAEKKNQNKKGLKV